MFHVGLDVGSVKTQVCVQNAKGERAFESSIKTTALRQYFFEQLKDLTQGPCQIVLESCAESFQIASWAKEAGHEARIVPSHFSRILGIGEGGVKTDQRDARALAEASSRVKLRSVHIRSEWARETISMSSGRTTLIKCRTATINSVRGWLRTQVTQRPRATPRTFPVNIRKVVDQLGREMPPVVEAQLKVIESLNEQLKTIEEELERRAKADPMCSLLMTIPGVGSLTALEFRAVIDTPERFKSGDKIGAYLGLTPGENSSSLRQRRTGVTKAGPAQMRRLLVQAAWVFARFHPPGDPMGTWYENLAERRGKSKAVVALARRLAVTMWGVWKHKKPYSPAHAAPETSVA